MPIAGIIEAKSQKAPVQKKPTVAERLKKFWYAAVDKTADARDAIGEFIGKYLAVGWPGFLCAFLLLVMQPAVGFTMTAGGLAFFIASLATAVIGLAANIALRPFNKRKEKVENLLTGEEKDQQSAVLLEKKIQKMFHAIRLYTATITKKVAAGSMEKAGDDYKNLMAMLSDSKTKKMTAAQRKLLTPESVDKLQSDIDTFIKEAKAAKAEHQKYQKTRWLRYFLYGFQTLTQAMGIAGLPFFVFLSTNALCFQFMSLPVIIGVVVFSALWGLVAGIVFAKEKKEEVDTHDANLAKLDQKVEEYEGVKAKLTEEFTQLSSLSSEATKVDSTVVDISKLKLKAGRSIDEAAADSAGKVSAKDLGKALGKPDAASNEREVDITLGAGGGGLTPGSNLIEV